MTIINYKINNQTAKELTASDWTSAQTLQAKTQAEEIAQFGWWSIIAVVTNNDNTITMCSVDENGVPLEFDDEVNNLAPYIDKTVAS
jgi:hypothetical protein